MVKGGKKIENKKGSRNKRESRIGLLIKAMDLNEI